MVSRTIICASVRRWALIQLGIAEGQRGTIRYPVPHPLERRIHGFILPLLGKGQIHVQEKSFSETSVAKNRSYALTLMKTVDESG
jgi:hypothetical protein